MDGVLQRWTVCCRGGRCVAEADGVLKRWTVCCRCGWCVADVDGVLQRWTVCCRCGRCGRCVADADLGDADGVGCAGLKEVDGVC